MLEPKASVWCVHVNHMCMRRLVVLTCVDLLLSRVQVSEHMWVGLCVVRMDGRRVNVQASIARAPTKYIYACRFGLSAPSCQDLCVCVCVCVCIRERVHLHTLSVSLYL